MKVSIEQGDLWTLSNRVFLCRIIKVEESTAHISILDNDQNEVIMHIPISIERLTVSLKERVGFNQILDPEVDEIINEWRMDKGGVWNINIEQVIELTLG